MRANVLIGAFFAHQPWFGATDGETAWASIDVATAWIGLVSKTDDDVAIPMKLVVAFDNVKYSGRQPEKYSRE